MAPPDLCPDCGGMRSAGICPRCLMRLGLGGPNLSLDHSGGPGATFELAGPGSVLGTLAATLGPVPHVLLRDTEPVTGPGPVVKPSSPEMPDLADRPARLQLLGEIARGGMGAILKGRDTDIGRDLAVKVLLEAHSAKPDLVRRFIEEAQIAGQLQHPGIAPIYELGAFADHRPYFAMKLVKGQTLAGLLDSRDGPGADLHRYLGIFEAVCQTMAYAHARGVIHRDLKPTNVMVGSFGEVQVMDWGLAKVLPRGGAAEDAEAGKLRSGETVISTPRSGSDSDLSVAGSVMGTPAYMAPEQARGEVDRLDERCDVFALGSILCEVLTGQPAFTGRNAAEIQRKAARGDLADALARLERCGAEADLLALARDCLAPEAGDRPHDAGVVTSRLSAYLASVQERMRTAELERARAEARAAEERKRRQLQRGLAAAVLALMVLGGGASWWVVQDRRDRRAQLGLALREAEVLREQAAADPAGDVGKWVAARKAIEQARARVGAAPTGVTRDRLSTLAAEIERGEAAARADRQLVNRLDEIRGTLDMDKASEAEYARAFAAAGLDPDHLDPAEFGRRLSAKPVAVARAAAEALDAWALIRGLLSRRKDAAAAPAAQRLVDVARAADPDPWRATLRDALARRDRDACRRAARDPALPRQSAADQWLLATSLEMLGDRDLAIEILRAAVRRHPQDYWINNSLGRALLGMQRSGPGATSGANSLDRLAKGSVRAEPYVQAALALRPHFAQAHHALGDSIAFQAGRIDEGIAEYREALRLKPDWVQGHNGLGNALEAKGDRDAAIAEFREAIRLQPSYASAHRNLGNALTANGDIDGAIAGIREWIRLQPSHAPAHHSLGTALRAKGDNDGAIAELREAIRLEPDYPAAYTNLGSALWVQGKRAEAEAAFRESIRLKSDDHYSHDWLGYTLRNSGRNEEAIPEFRRAIELKPDNFQAYRNLGGTLKELGRTEEAIALYREGLRVVPISVECAIGLADLIEAKDGIEPALAVLREAIRLNPASASAHISLGYKLAAHGNLDAAIVSLREAYRLQPDNPPYLITIVSLLKKQGQLDAAVADCREAVRLDPGDPLVHQLLALTLDALEQREAAVAEFREAIRLAPQYFPPHLNLGKILKAQGQLDAAIAECREAVRLSPKAVAAHLQLGETLVAQGQLDAAIAEFREVVRLSPSNARVREILGSALWTKANDARARSLHATVTRLAAEAFAADPKLADDPARRARYSAACSAALASCAKGHDDSPTDADGPTDAVIRAKFRRQALDWLQAEVAALGRTLEAGDAEARRGALPNLRAARLDPDLAGVREPAALEALPEAERAEWRALWAEVDRLLAKDAGGNL